MNRDSEPAPLAHRAESRDPAELLALGSDPFLTEEIALTLLTRRDLPPNVIEAIAKNPAVLKHRKVTLAVVAHPRTPRHISLPIARTLYTFELVKLALLPPVPTDVKIGIDETILSRLEQVSEGERLTLAKQASGRVAGTLLLDAQERVVASALQNPQMTEAVLIKALGSKAVPAHTVRRVCNDPKWSLRRDVRLALLRNEHTPLASAIKFAEALPERLVRDILSKSQLAPPIKRYLLAKWDGTNSDPALDDSPPDP